MSGTKKVFEVLGAAPAVADMAGGWLLAEMPPHVSGPRRCHGCREGRSMLSPTASPLRAPILFCVRR